MNIPYGIMFHHFHGGTHRPDKANSLSKIQFEKILNFVGIKNILSPNEWINLSNLGKLKSYHRCITFDDGLKNQFDIALPVLQKYNLKAFWFIYSAQYYGDYPRLDIFRKFRYHYFDNISEYYKEFFSQDGVKNPINDQNFKSWKNHLSKICPFYSDEDLKYRYTRDLVLGPKKYLSIVEKLIKLHNLKLSDLTNNLWLTKSDLRLLSKQGHVLGLHSHNHPTVLRNLTQKQQETQYIKNKNFIKKYSSSIVSMAHPCNSYNKTTLKILSNMGIKIGFRANTNKKNIINSFKNLQLPREDCTNILHKFIN